MFVLHERSVVRMAETDHRIANNLSSLSGLIGLERRAISKSDKTFTTEQVCLLLDNITARIQVTARLHKFLAMTEPQSRVTLGTFLQQIAEMVSKLNPEGMLVVTFDNSCDVNIDPHHALKIGLITAELLTNATKYAHPSGCPVKVHTRCETNADGSFVVEVTDDGIGFPKNFDPDKDGGVGFRVMRALASELHAELQFERGNRGVYARLVRPALPNSRPVCAAR